MLSAHECILTDHNEKPFFCGPYIGLTVFVETHACRFRMKDQFHSVFGSNDWQIFFPSWETNALVPSKSSKSPIVGKAVGGSLFKDYTKNRLKAVRIPHMLGTPVKYHRNELAVLRTTNLEPESSATDQNTIAVPRFNKCNK